MATNKYGTPDPEYLKMRAAANAFLNKNAEIAKAIKAFAKSQDVDTRTAVQYIGYACKDYVKGTRGSKSEQHETRRQREEQSSLNTGTVTRKKGKASADADVLAQILAGVQSLNTRVVTLEKDLGVNVPPAILETPADDEPASLLEDASLLDETAPL